MKKSIVTLALISITSLGFSQRGEIKSAEKAIDKEDFDEALAELNKAEAELEGEKEKWVVRYHLAKAKVYGNKAANQSNDNMLDDLNTSLESLDKVFDLDEGNQDALSYQAQVRQNMVQTAIDGQNDGNFEIAQKLLYKTYQLDKNDTVMLYYAASAAVNGQMYDEALEQYQELLDLGFDGSTTQFVATNKETGEEEVFESESMRDVAVKSGEFENPDKNKTPRLTGEIAKNVSLIYIQQDRAEEALQAIERAKKENPGDIDIKQAEADLYYRLGKVDKYNEVMKEVVELDPENPSLYYNLGVASEELGDKDSAREYYLKAAELDEEMVNAYINLAALTLSEEREIVEEMNNLGNSKADNKKYQELNEKKKQFYIDALPYLEKATELDPTNMNALQTRLNIYYQVGEDEKAEELQKKIKELRE